LHPVDGYRNAECVRTARGRHGNKLETQLVHVGAAIAHRRGQPACDRNGGQDDERGDNGAPPDAAEASLQRRHLAKPRGIVILFGVRRLVVIQTDPRPDTSDAPTAIITHIARTTIDIDAAVLRRLKERKRREGKTLGQLVSELLAGALRETATPTPRELDWTSRSMGARVDLEDKEAVRRALEGR
jgi:hypothetical protein